MSETAPPATAQPAESVVQLPPPKVLFVDDESSILKALRRLFADEEFDVVTANSGEEGLEVLRKEKEIGLIVSDQRMPGLSGVEFLEQSQQLAPDIIRVVLTGYADVNAAIGAINRGRAFRYVTKPWNEDELLQTVREGLEIYTLKRENEELNRIVRQQNEELQKWNDELKLRVDEQTKDIRQKAFRLKALNQRLRQDFDHTILAFSGLLELRDKAAQSHSQNVTQLALQLAEALNLERPEKKRIRIAALLHDIGKIGMPDTMLAKRKNVEEMDDHEFRQYVRHPVRGQAAVDSVTDLRPAGELIRHHHENYDGSGFPDRLQGAAIPIGSRIIALADFADHEIAASEEGNPVENCLERVRRLLNKRFDPELVPPLGGLLKELYAGTALKQDTVEIEIPPDRLKPGLVLARDARSGTGLMLLRKGVVLDTGNISALERYYRLDPSTTGIFVWKKREES